MDRAIIKVVHYYEDSQSPSINPFIKWEDGNTSIKHLLKEITSRIEAMVPPISVSACNCNASEKQYMDITEIDMPILDLVREFQLNEWSVTSGSSGIELEKINRLNNRLIQQQNLKMHLHS